MIKKIFIVIIVFAVNLFASEDSNSLAKSLIDESKTIREEIQLEDYRMPFEPNLPEKNELSNLVDELNSLTFSVKMAAAPDVIAEPNEPNEPNDAKSVEIGFADIIQQVINEPNNVVDILKLADALFLNNNLDQAEVFYGKAEASIADSNDIQNNSNYAWILFQLGNCCRQSKPEQAFNYYQKLIELFPSNQWAEQALVQQKIAKLLTDEKQSIDFLENPPQLEIIK